MSRIVDLTEIITKGTTPTTIGFNFENEGINFVKIESITDRGTIDPSNVAFISEECHKKMKRSQLKKGDLLLSIAGNIGRMTVVDEKILPANTNQAIGIIRFNMDMVNPYFIKYLFSTDWYKSKIINANAQSVQKNINLKNIGELEVELPDINQQNKIANILKNIDDKIDNNNKIAANLEELAKTIYEYWFLQFDFPDANGNPYKTSGGRMIWNDDLRREIPEEWGAKPLSAVLTLLKDGTHNPPKRVDDGVPLLTGKMFGQTFLDYSQATFITESDYKTIHSQYSPQESDIILTKIGTLGNVNYLRKKDIPIAIHCNSALLRFPDIMTGMFSLMYCKSEEFQKRLKATKGQSIQEFCSLENIGSVLMMVPDKKTIELYNAEMSSVMQDMERISEENQLLTSLRGWLLPMLMNGQIKVSD